MNWNVVILGRNAIQIAVALHHLLAIKLREYQKYPLAHKVGFIHSLPEDKFDMANATITDVSFMRLFPKALLQILLQYANKIKRFNRDDNKFRALIDDLITAFIYRPITMQKIIQIMVVHKKNELQALDTRNLTTPSSSNNDASRQTSNAHPNNQRRSTETIRICQANKCRILRAQGALTKKHVLH